MIQRKGRKGRKGFRKGTQRRLFLGDLCATLSPSALNAFSPTRSDVSIRADGSRKCCYNSKTPRPSKVLAVPLTNSYTHTANGFLRRTDVRRWLSIKKNSIFPSRIGA